MLLEKLRLQLRLRYRKKEETKLKTKLTFVFLIILLFTIFPFREIQLFAGNTGKITGVITDSETRLPMVGTNVIVEGSFLGAATDMDGNYVILNVSPGIHTLRVTMIGYIDFRVENVMVSIDLTTTINAALEQTVLDAGGTVTVTAERPLVRLDMTSSLSSISAVEIENLPVQTIDDVLELQAGIIRDVDNFHIRGGRAGEVAYWVDGISATDVFSGDKAVTVENSAVQELQVVSGTFNAEYGQAMSGIINIVTKEGGQKYSGQIKTYVGDYVSSDDKFSILKTVDVVTDPLTGVSEAIGKKENPLKNFNPTYNAEFSLSGPLGKRLSFFTNARYFSNEGYLYGREWFTPHGLEGDSSLVSLNPSERFSSQGKLTYRVTDKLKVSYNIFWNQWKNENKTYYADMDRDNRNELNARNFRYVPGGLPQEIGNGMTHIMSLNHILSPKTFYEVRLTRFYTEFQRYSYEDPNAKIKYWVEITEDASKGIDGEKFDPFTTEGAVRLDSIKALGAEIDYIVAPDSPEGYIDPDWVAPPTSDSFYKRGMSLEHYERSTAYWIGKFDFTSQVTRANQLRFGAELRQHELILDQFTIQENTDVNQFEPDIPDEASFFHCVYNRQPREFSTYIQDKIELNEIILNVGLRYDYFDANSVIPVDTEDPNIHDPFKNNNIYKNWDQDIADTLSAQDLGEYKNSLDEYTSDERRAFMHKEVKPLMQLSPRLGIAYPITDKGVIHFSYGHFFQIPEFRYLYNNPDFKLSRGGEERTFGNADLKPQKTVMYEIGLQQQMTKDIGIDITLFYRDVRNWVGSSPLIDTPNPSIKYSQYENRDYANIRGVTLKFEKRYSNNFSARMDYTYQVAEGTYSNPNDAYNDIEDNKEPRKALVPMAWDQKHTINGSIVYRISGWTISMIGKYWSGRPYTPRFPSGEYVGGAARKDLLENSERNPNQKSVNLYINRRIMFGSLEFNLFLNVYNLFDQRDETNVYTDTGSADYTTETNPAKIPYNSERVGTVEDYVNRPDWYTAPRQIQTGITVSF